MIPDIAFICAQFPIAKEEGNSGFGTVYVTLSASAGPVVIKKSELNDDARMSFKDEMACQSKL